MCVCMLVQVLLMHCLTIFCSSVTDDALRKVNVSDLVDSERRPPSPPLPPSQHRLADNISPTMATALLQLISQQDSQGRPPPQEPQASQEPFPQGTANTVPQNWTIPPENSPLTRSAHPTQPQCDANSTTNVTANATSSSMQFPRDQDFRFTQMGPPWAGSLLKTLGPRTIQRPAKKEGRGSECQSVFLLRREDIAGHLFPILDTILSFLTPAVPSPLRHNDQLFLQTWWKTRTEESECFCINVLLRTISKRYHNLSAASRLYKAGTFLGSLRKVRKCEGMG